MLTAVTPSPPTPHTVPPAPQSPTHPYLSPFLKDGFFGLPACCAVSWHVTGESTQKSTPSPGPPAPPPGFPAQGPGAGAITTLGSSLAHFAGPAEPQAWPRPPHAAARQRWLSLPSAEVQTSGVRPAHAPALPASRTLLSALQARGPAFPSPSKPPAPPLLHGDREFKWGSPRGRAGQGDPEGVAQPHHPSLGGRGPRKG